MHILVYVYISCFFFSLLSWKAKLKKRVLNNSLHTIQVLKKPVFHLFVCLRFRNCSTAGSLGTCVTKYDTAWIIISMLSIESECSGVCYSRWIEWRDVFVSLTPRVWSSELRALLWEYNTILLNRYTDIFLWFAYLFVFKKKM